MIAEWWHEAITWLMLTSHQCDAGAHFTDDFSITIQIRWKFQLAVIQLLVIISQQKQNFAHATTGQLSGHVQNFLAITSFEFGWEQNEISLTFELWWKKYQWNGPLGYKPSAFSSQMLNNMQIWADIYSLAYKLWLSNYQYQLYDSWQQSYIHQFDGLAQDCGNSIANAMELPQSCAKPSILQFLFPLTSHFPFKRSFISILLRKFRLWWIVILTLPRNFRLRWLIFRILPRIFRLRWLIFRILLRSFRLRRLIFRILLSSFRLWWFISHIYSMLIQQI